MIHQRTHPQYVEGCFACRISTVGVSAAALPTRGHAVTAIAAKEKQWDRDMPAYKEMRRQGLQPKSIDGAADLATRAVTDTEIRMGKVFDGPRKQVEASVKRANEICQEAGMA